MHRKHEHTLCKGLEMCNEEAQKKMQVKLNHSRSWKRTKMGGRRQ